jgi:hypothetical protein
MLLPGGINLFVDYIACVLLKVTVFCLNEASIVKIIRQNSKQDFYIIACCIGIKVNSHVNIILIKVFISNKTAYETCKLLSGKEFFELKNIVLLAGVAIITGFKGFMIPNKF